MNTCKTCQYWTNTEVNEWDYHAKPVCNPLDADTGKPMDTGIEVRICAHPAQTFGERPVEKNGFGVIDGSDYYARLITAEGFGCVRHLADSL